MCKWILVIKTYYREIRGIETETDTDTDTETEQVTEHLVSLVSYKEKVRRKELKLYF